MSRFGQNNGYYEAPEPTERRYKRALLRIKPGNPIHAIVLNDFPVGRYVHWNGYRNMPCTEIDCPECRKNTRRDWKMWISVWLPTSDEVAIIELPYSGLKFFEKQRERSASCRGFHAEFSRYGEKAKGRAVVLFRHKEQVITNLPDAIDCANYMDRVFGVSYSDPTPREETRGNSRQGNRQPAFNPAQNSVPIV